MLVTPELAAEWLRFNTHNRSLSRKRVQRYARLMREKKWRLNGESIKFDSRRAVLDGQDRLEAVVESGMSVRMVVVSGLSFTDMLTVDEGGVRTSTHALQIQGFEHPATLAGAAKLVLRYKRAQPLNLSLVPTNAELSEFVKREAPGLKDSVAFVHERPACRLVPASVLAFFHYVGSQTSKKDASAFVRSLQGGEGLRAGAPVYVLREQILGMHAARRRPRTNELIVLLARAWNALRSRVIRSGESGRTTGGKNLSLALGFMYTSFLQCVLSPRVWL